MRQKLIPGILVFCALVFATAGSKATNLDDWKLSTTSWAASSGKTGGRSVVGDGCLRAGVEAGCLALTTSDKKNKYSLRFDPKNKPAVDTMIHFEGTTMDVDTCMQGTPVKVTKWNELKMKCPAESK